MPERQQRQKNNKKGNNSCTNSLRDDFWVFSDPNNFISKQELRHIVLLPPQTHPGVCIPSRIFGLEGMGVGNTPHNPILKIFLMCWRSQKILQKIVKWPVLAYRRPFVQEVSVKKRSQTGYPPPPCRAQKWSKKTFAYVFRQPSGYLKNE